MRDLSIAEQCIPRKCKDDLVSRRQVYRLKLASDNDWEFGQALMDMPSAEPKIKCVAKVTLSQEQIQDAVDMAVKKMKAELEPCDFCKHKDDCGYMSMYCPAERRTDG